MTIGGDMRVHVLRWGGGRKAVGRKVSNGVLFRLECSFDWSLVSIGADRMGWDEEIEKVL